MGLGVKGGPGFGCPKAKENATLVTIRTQSRTPTPDLRLTLQLPAARQMAEPPWVQQSFDGIGSIGSRGVGQCLNQYFAMSKSFISTVL